MSQQVPRKTGKLSCAQPWSSMDIFSWEGMASSMEIISIATPRVSHHRYKWIWKCEARRREHFTSQHIFCNTLEKRKKLHAICTHEYFFLLLLLLFFSRRSCVLVRINKECVFFSSYKLDFDFLFFVLNQLHWKSIDEQHVPYLKGTFLLDFFRASILLRFMTLMWFIGCTFFWYINWILYFFSWRFLRVPESPPWNPIISTLECFHILKNRISRSSSKNKYIKIHQFKLSSCVTLQPQFRLTFSTHSYLSHSDRRIISVEKALKERNFYDFTLYFFMKGSDCVG